MPAFKGKDGTGWKDASAIYGKNSSGWQYGKEAFVKNASGWQRVWTDCRKYDAGGRDWSSPSTVTTYTGSCSTRNRVETTTRTKTGCPDDVRVVTVSDPNCTGCTGTPYISNSCDGCGSITTTPGTGGCPDTTSGSCGSWTYVDPFSGPSTIVVSGVTYNASLYGYTTYASCGYCQIDTWDAEVCNASGSPVYRLVNYFCASLEFC